MPKNLPMPAKSTELTLGKTKSLLGMTAKILKSNAVATTHKDITIIGDLMWAKTADEEMIWDDAMEYAKNLRLGGYDDWRLPTREELGDIVTLCGGELWKLFDGWEDKGDRNKANTQYQEAYKTKGFASSFYWSSTTVADYEYFAWAVGFYGGNDSWGGKSYDSHVRCVRGGE